MAVLDNIDLDKITPLSDWFDRVGLPYRSGMRLIANGKGPAITQITERRRGVRERDHLAWLNARRQPVSSADTAA